LKYTVLRKYLVYSNSFYLCCPSLLMPPTSGLFCKTSIFTEIDLQLFSTMMYPSFHMNNFGWVLCCQVLQEVPHTRHGAMQSTPGTEEPELRTCKQYPHCISKSYYTNFLLDFFKNEMQVQCFRI